MANVTKLKHLEHLEDEMLNYGVEGCEAAVGFLQELRKMLGSDDSKAFMQTKWDGAPSIVCGKDPANGLFFVGTKSVFNTTEPKICYSEADVDKFDYKGDLAEKLKMSLKYFMNVGIEGVRQGDLMYTKSTVKTETIHGERLYTFRPNTITYGIPVDHEIGKKIKASQIGVVFHTHYTGEQKGYDLSTMSARAGANTKFTDNKDVVIINNDTPMHKVGLNHQEETQFDNMVKSIETNCKKCGDFLDQLVLFSGTKGDEKYHVASYVKPFFNSEIKAARTLGDTSKTFANLYNFYYDKTKALVDKIKTPATKAQKSKLIHHSQNYLRDNEDKFKSMIDLYKELQDIKQFVIDKLDHLETFKTFALTDNGYKVTGPEGYVLHKDGDMIKFVNRLEFAFLNFTLAKKWR